MEWVETTGRTLEEAKEAALDELGVDDTEAEFEIVEEPKSGLFGRVRGEARVRARVRPTTPRPKVDRRRGRPGKSKGGEGRGRSDKTDKTDKGDGGDRQRPSGDDRADTRSRPDDRRRGKPGRTSADRDEAPVPAPRANERSGGSQDMDDGASLEEQAEMARSFVDGLVDAFGLEGDTRVTVVEDDDAVEVEVDGDDLGLMIGPKGQTLVAVQELTRTVLQRQSGAGRTARVRVDAGGYRQRRREALARFATKLAEQVLADGAAKALEPMNAADRKVVHDTVNDIDGVASLSEGEDPRRYVVIVPDEDLD